MGVYDATKLAALVAACNSKKKISNRAKGETLADVVQYAFMQAAGIDFAERNYIEHDGTGEIDLMFRIDPFTAQLFSGVTLLVECKHEARPIGAAQVNTFAGRLEDHNQPVGVMVTSKGLSGRRRQEAAHRVVTIQLGRGRTIVVITLAEMAGLADSDMLLKLCRDRRQELECYRQYTSI